MTKEELLKDFRDKLFDDKIDCDSEELALWLSEKIDSMFHEEIKYKINSWIHKNSRLSTQPLYAWVDSKDLDVFIESLFKK